MEDRKKISNEEIFTELEALLNFYSLKNSPILSKFLRYIVTETLNENQHFIKEYSIAVNVLNRSSDFNCNDDAVVRIHAGRLRRILTEYYLTQGINNYLSITIPKGCYIPQFVTKDNRPPPPSVPSHNETNPIIAVFPFKSIPYKPNLSSFSLFLSEEISAELSRFEDISVISHFGSHILSKIEENPLEAAKLIHADYLITGSIQYREQKIHTRINLINALTGEFIMVKTFDHEIITEKAHKIQSEIVEYIVATLGGYYGFIFKQTTIKISDSLNKWRGIYNYYQYQRNHTLQNYELALKTNEEAVLLHTDHAVSWAILGELYLYGIGHGIKTNQNLLEKGNHCVMQSLKINPLCQHSWHALTLVHLYKREKEECLYAAEKCVQLNPNAVGLLSGVGSMLICAGFFDRGFTIMEKATQLNPHYPWWVNSGYSFYYLHKKDYVNALHWAEKIDCEETFLDPLLKVAALSHMNKEKAAIKQFHRLLKIESEIPQIKKMLCSFLLSSDLVSHIIGGLERIRLIIPD